MRKNIIVKWIAILCSISAVCSSCESWLQVKMKDKILEEELFKDVEGYMSALNGIYASLNEESIYGNNLSMGVIDVMAQYYDVKTAKDHTYETYGDYDYTQESYKKMQSAVWSKIYALLANVNLLLENCQRADSPLPELYSELIQGEAYALRGMLHFDLLRLWGPVYSETTKSTECIPYMEASDRVVRPLLTAETVLEKVIADLEMAEDLLADSDPVIEEGPKNGSGVTDVNNYLNYRQYRLNYYAVKALLARAWLWKGENGKAAEKAGEVVEVADSWFPFVSREEVLKEDAQKPDRICSKEVLFGLYNTSRTNLDKKLFVESISASSRLTLNGSYAEGRIRTMYPDEQDCRFGLWVKTSTDTTEIVYSTKYKDNSDPKNQYMIPLIRTSEMFLILAECSASVKDASDWLNKVRFPRGCLDAAVTEETKDGLIQDEFMREMRGEGQMFFFYKRKGVKNIPDGATAIGTREMNLDSYIWPLPDDEQMNRLMN